MGKASRPLLKPIDVAATAFCASLYAGFGYLAWLGIVCPVVGIVRFWPVVIIPAVFAYLFGPLVGGLGAAIGIFVSDMLIHGDPLLSLSVGVPANFLGFYTVGYLSRREVRADQAIFMGTLVASGLLLTIGALGAWLPELITPEVELIFVIVCLISFIAVVLALCITPKWKSYHLACTFGLLLGSAVIGVGVWAYSQFFVLPKAVGGGSGLPLWAALVWFIWTFLTEIPFMLVLGPPILEACLRAYPNLVRRGA